MSYPQKDIIDQIKMERKKQGITQTELANLIGCPQPSIVRIETKKISPTIGMLQRICDVLGMDITLVKKKAINCDLALLIYNNNLYFDFVQKLFKPYFRKIEIIDNGKTGDSTSYPESECIIKLQNELNNYVDPYSNNKLLIRIDFNTDVYYQNNNSPVWKIGNIKNDDIDELIRRIMEKDIPAFIIAKTITIGELINKYGNPNSNNSFSLDEYKLYLLNKHLNNVYNIKKDVQSLISELK